MCCLLLFQVCIRQFSISHGGKNDVNKHAQTVLHINNYKARSSTTPVQNFFISKSKPEDDEVIRIETLFAIFVAEHNLDSDIADHFIELIKQMFPKVPSVQKLHCDSTKTMQITVRPPTPVLKEEVVDNLEENAFCTAID